MLIPHRFCIECSLWQDRGSLVSSVPVCVDGGVVPTTKPKQVTQSPMEGVIRSVCFWVGPPSMLFAGKMSSVMLVYTVRIS